MEKEKTALLSQLEDTNTSISRMQEGQKNTRSTLAEGQFEVKPKEETPKEEPVVSTGTNELPGTRTGKKRA
ncbi:hypothetical protein [Morganella morganii]|uniref:hypothetical protein n=1 Tax=Morganella morganii TaxID=582 RepID=UPI0030FEA1A6